MISERHTITIKPAPKLAWCVLAVAAAPALALIPYGAPTPVIVAVWLMSVGVVTPAVRAIWRPQLHLVLNGSQLLAYDRSRRLQFRETRPRAVVTPWALCVWPPWSRGVTLFRCQLDDRDYRRLAAWLHR